MANIAQLLTEHIDIWTAAETEKKSGRGRASGNTGSVYGVKKLRELILELAVRGRLVPQDPNDEPASELLKRIQAEKAKLIAEGKLKKEKPLALISEDEKPFELPKGWEWARLGNLTYIEMGQSPDSENYNQLRDGIPFFQGKADFGALYPTERYWCNKPNKYSYPGDILLSIRAPVGPTNIANQECCIGRGLAALRPIKDLETFYLLTLMRSFEKVLQSKATGTTFSAVSRSDIDSLILPICSLNQQRLIVNKVDELMALCDQLEQQHSNAQEAHETLVSQLLATLTQSQNAAELNANWQRIYAHFDVLFTTEASIDALKQTLLQLAVMGKLVPQEPNDEKVEYLIHRIKKSEAERVRNKEIQKPRELITESEPVISIPKSWSFNTLGEIAFVTKLAGFEYTDNINLKDVGEVPVIRAQNVRPFLPELDNLKFIDLETSQKLFRSALDRPCLLVTFIGAGIGDVCVFDKTERWHLAPNVAKVEPFGDINVNYLNIFLNSPNGRSEIFKFMKSTAQPSLSMRTIREIWIPLPPLAEQNRIVSKVDALVALCDQLKTHIQQTNQQQQAIADALVVQAVA